MPRTRPDQLKPIGSRVESRPRNPFPNGLRVDPENGGFEGGVYARGQADREGQHLQFAGDYRCWLAALGGGR